MKKPVGTFTRETTLVYGEDGSPLVEQVQVEVFVGAGPDSEKSAILGEKGLVIGTHKKASFHLKDRSVSRRHAELSLAEDGVRVHDLGSTNGVLVGGSRITDAVVPLGSTLVLGETELEIREMVERYPLPLSRRRRFGDLIGSSAAMRQVYALLERAAEVDMTVLIEGETGTGKELAARALHDYSTRASGPYQIIDCGAVSPTLIEAELFGHEKGAFTSADRDRTGAFEEANGGTLFFDEIGELPLNLQPKLLRALENRVIQRIGSSKRVPVDVRFLAATNRNLEEEVKRGRFREDLYYRLNVFKVNMPALREHRDDIPRLVKHFLGPFGNVRLSEEIVNRMVQLDWPGNVRELRNAVERAVVLARNDSKKDPAEESDQGFTDIDLDVNRPFKDLKANLVSSFEKTYINKVLKRNNGNISASARQSGIDRKHLERLIRKHGIKP
ncbi:MAG: sigma 54-dependent Fis family transcriptional regulator [Deltaproteobacteria bacterium]|nr:sigma 54-dependent Fis family transcriptional regulator [Deltaproteobacteria bacterium]